MLKLYSLEDNPAAHCILARLNKRGIGVPQNEKKAIELYVKSCQGGSKEAFAELSKMAEKNLDAQYELGKMYENGTIAPVAPCAHPLSYADIAVTWYNQAASGRHEQALNALTALGEKGNKRAVENLVIYFSNAARTDPAYRQQTRYWSNKYTELFFAPPKEVRSERPTVY